MVDANDLKLSTWKMSGHYPLHAHNRFLCLPADMVLTVTKIEDLPTLQRFLIAFPSAAPVFLPSFNTVIGEILRRSLHEECQQYVYAIVSACTASPLVNERLVSLLDGHFDEKPETNCPLANILTPKHHLIIWVRVLEATEFFVEFCTLVFSRGRSSPFTAPPEVSLIKFRIRRALLRFQLFCELFHQPGESSDSISDWKARFPDQELFWIHFMLPWEVEEYKWVYYLLVLCPRDCTGKDWKMPGPALGSNDDDSLQYQGLPDLQIFIKDKAPHTKFGLSYVHRFLDRALYGFSIVDPEDLNYFFLNHDPNFHMDSAGVKFPERKGGRQVPLLRDRLKLLPPTRKKGFMCSSLVGAFGKSKLSWHGALIDSIC